MFCKRTPPFFEQALQVFFSKLKDSEGALEVVFYPVKPFVQEKTTLEEKPDYRLSHLPN